MFFWALYPGLTQQVDDSLIVGGKQTDGVFEEKHEGGIDNTIRQLVGVCLDTHTGTI